MVKYYCDKCGKDVTGGGWATIELPYYDEFCAKYLKKIELCDTCYGDLREQLGMNRVWREQRK